MESIIDRVINELVFRLTSSRGSARAANAEPAQPSAAAAPQVPQQQPEDIASPTSLAAAPQAQQPTPPPAPEPTPPPEPTEAIVERELQRVVAEARQELDAAALIVAELRASADGFSERIAATGERLERFDGWLLPVESPQSQAYAEPTAPAQAPWAQPESVSPPASPPQAQPAFQAPEPDQFAAEAAIIPTRTVSLTVDSLSNLTVVSVVEAALLRIPGVREVALRQLQGRKAILEVRLDEGTGLISGLRKSLPLAFDVIESSDHSLEISLSYAGAHPVTNGGGGTGPTLA